MPSPSAIKAGSAYVELLINDSAMVRGLEKASKRLKAFGDSIAGVGKKFLAIGTAVAAPMVGFAKLWASGGDALMKMSRRTGITVESLSELGYAAERSGTDIETVEKSVRKMHRTLSAAAGGSKSSIESLAQLGLSLEDLKGLSPIDQLKLIGDRIGKLPSAAQRAASAVLMFGRAGAAMIPMFAEGSATLDQYMAEARKFGLTTSTESAAAAEDLTVALDLLWRVLKKLWTTIGSSIGPLLTDWAYWIIDVVVQVKDWIKENQELVQWVFKIAVAVMAAGAGILALGKAVTFAGAAVGGIASIFSAIGSAIGVIGSILASILSPLGLVIGMVVALGGYLVYSTGIGGKALGWLADQFQNLKTFALESFQGIADALAAGDLALAARILWASLKVAWEAGTLELERLWLGFRNYFVHMAYDAFYGALAAWELLQHGLTVAWIETIAFLSNAWTGFTAALKSVWETTQRWLSDRFLELMGMFDETLNVELAQSINAQDSEAAQNQIKDEESAALASREQERVSQRDLEYTQHQQNLNKIAEEGKAKDDALNQDKADRLAQAQKELDDAQAEWKDLLGQAKDERTMKESEGPHGLPRPADMPDWLDGIGDVVAEKASKIEARGTFNPMAAFGMGTGSTVNDRIAKATEKTAKFSERMKELMEQWKGEEFD